MDVYIFLITLSVFFVILSPNNKGAGYLILFLLLIFSMFRGETVGIDTCNYYNNNFSSANNPSYIITNHSFEFIFIGICDLINKYNLNPRWCIYFLSLVTFSFLSLSSRSFNVPLTFVCFFYLLLNVYSLSLNIARQMAACSIVLYAYSFLQFNTNKKFLFFVYILLAASIHFTAIVFSFCYFARFLNKSKFVSSKLIIIIALLLFAGMQLWREKILSLFSNYLGAIAIYGKLGSETESSSLSIFGFFYRAISIVLNLIVYSYVRLNSNRTMSSIFLIGIFCKILISPFYGNIARLNWFLSIIDIIVFSLFFGEHTLLKDHNKLAFFIMFSVYYFIDFYLVLSANTYGTVPYVISFQ